MDTNTNTFFAKLLQIQIQKNYNFRRIISSGKSILSPAMARNFTPKKSVKCDETAFELWLLTIDEKKMCRHRRESELFTPIENLKFVD